MYERFIFVSILCTVCGDTYNYSPFWTRRTTDGIIAKFIPIVLATSTSTGRTTGYSQFFKERLSTACNNYTPDATTEKQNIDHFSAGSCLACRIFVRYCCCYAFAQRTPGSHYNYRGERQPFPRVRRGKVHIMIDFTSTVCCYCTVLAS